MSHRAREMRALGHRHYVGAYGREIGRLQFTIGRLQFTFMLEQGLHATASWLTLRANDLATYPLAIPMAGRGAVTLNCSSISTRGALWLRYNARR